MRRKRRKNNLKYIFIIIIFIFLLGTAYSYLKTTLNIEGVISGNDTSGYQIITGSNPNLRMNVASINPWQDNNLYHYQYAIDVTNIGSMDVNNFELTLNYSDVISAINIWNYEYSLNEKTILVINNNKILPNGTVRVEFIISSTKKIKLFSIKFDVEDQLVELPISNYALDFIITGGWGQYTYQYNVNLTNKSNKKINAWRIEIPLLSGTYYVSGWNGIFTSETNKLIIDNASHNGVIDNNGTVSIGLQLNTNVQNFIPQNAKVYAR